MEPVSNSSRMPPTVPWNSSCFPLRWFSENRTKCSQVIITASYIMSLRQQSIQHLGQRMSSTLFRYLFSSFLFFTAALYSEPAHSIKHSQLCRKAICCAPQTGPQMYAHPYTHSHSLSCRHSRYSPCSREAFRINLPEKQGVFNPDIT